MPLQSRLTRTPTAPSNKEPQAGVDLNTSPRKRGLARAAQDSAAEPRQDTLEQQEREEAAQPPQEQEAPPPPPQEERAAPRKRATGKKRGPKPKPALPEDAAQSDDPAVLREVLKRMEAEAKERRQEFERGMKDLRTQYAMVSTKLAELL